MSLTPGQKIGPYNILERAGAGGMGEVFRAHDSRLDRIVAIKVLPAIYADNPALRQRFEREAKAISSLNHPHICTLFDIGRENGTDYLVLEYLEGQTLSDKLKNGALNQDELLRYSIQIADALEQAHRQGLVHRDLKPQNVIITRNGAKLLDFGLAKLQVHDGVVEGVSGITRSTPLTGEGTIIGTIQYMSPEQLEGKETDNRSDIFAFGTLLYEMATGQRAFQASSQASLIASILTKEPRPLSELMPLTPPMLERAIKQCLAKDPDQRWQSCGDLKRTLQWIAEGGSQFGIPAPVAAQRKRQLHASWIVASVTSLAAIVLAWLWFSQPKPEVRVTKFQISPASDIVSVFWPMISPDGMMLAYRGRDTSSVTSLYVRPINSLQAVALPGTSGAGRHFWSPDSKFLAFFEGNQLKKVSAQGGPVQLIGEANGGSDGTWGAAGIILFDGGQGDSLQKIPAAGGKPTTATRLRHDLGDSFHAWPWFLPDGEHFLYYASDSLTVQRQGYRLVVATLDGSLEKELGRVNGRVVYAPEGYILHARDGVLYARPFDLDRLEVTGEDVPIAENVGGNAGELHFNTSDNGLLTYRLGAGSTSDRKLVWIARDGKPLGQEGELGAYQDVALSPDGNRLAYGLVDERAQTGDIWVRDLRRGVSSRLTFEGQSEVWPIWSPDGTRIIYASDQSGRFEIWERLANGIGEPRFLYGNAAGNTGPSGWNSDATALLVSVAPPNWDIAKITYGDSASANILIKTPKAEMNGVLSPNGRYIAYASNETGQVEIFVRDLGPAGGKWQVTSDFGRIARWRSDGKELVYVNNAYEFKAVQVNTAGVEFEVGKPVRLFTQPYPVADIPQFRWDMTADAQKFIVCVAHSAQAVSHIVVVQNWAEELKRR